MSLSELAFTALVDTGCTTCGSRRLTIESLVVQNLPLLAGEPFGPPSWGYKGEELVHGTYKIACDGCKKLLFTSSACPLCSAEGGIARALETENAFPLPAACASCKSEQLTATAYVPAVVLYEGKRANKARTQTKPEDAGFHTVRVECKSCHDVSERHTPCPLCSYEAAP